MRAIENFQPFKCRSSTFRNSAHSGRTTDINVDVNWCPHFRSIIQLDAVGITTVPQGNDLSFFELSNIGLHGIANLETKSRRHNTSVKTSLEQLYIQVLANKDKAGFTSFVTLPLDVSKVPVEQHANALKDKLLVHALDRKDSLVAVQIRAIFLNQTLNPTLQHGNVQFTIHLGGKRRDSRVMLMLSVFVQKLGVKIQNSRQFKRVDIQELCLIRREERKRECVSIGSLRILAESFFFRILYSHIRTFGTNVTIFGPKDRSRRIEATKAFLDLDQLVVPGDQINLVKDDLVGKDNLLNGLILDAFRFLLVQAVTNVLGIYDTAATTIDIKSNGEIYSPSTS